MLEIAIPEHETFEGHPIQRTIHPAQVLRLEHSLLSMSKWESFWEIPFLTNEKRTQEQLLSYIAYMSEEPVNPQSLLELTPEDFEKINTYLSAKHSATWFGDEPEGTLSGQVVTSELMYYWMTAQNIPFECETWPLQRLMNLIRIASIKNNPDPKKKRAGRTLSDRAALNRKRREEMGTKG